jgi:NADH-quinone oxidoreductase subunit E
MRALKAREQNGTVMEVISLHDHKKNNLIQILLSLQEKERFLSRESLLVISKELEIPLTKVYQAATFYNAFSFKPRGKHLIQVCTGTACHVRGAPLILERMIRRLEVDPGNTTADRRFTLQTANCLGCCALGPVVAINDRYFSDPSAAELEKILKKFD